MKIHNKKVHVVLRGKIDKTQRIWTISVWCPFCKEYHVHGFPKNEKWKSNDVSHRTAHCSNEDSPFKKKGYFVAVEK